jgi:hypothetical protein
MDLIEEIKIAVDKLNEVDDYASSLADKLSIEDKKTCDLLHYIENNKLTTSECYRVIKEIKSIRIDRRKIKNDMELSTTLNNNKNKLQLKENRVFLINELHKKNKQLNTKYSNRYYTNEDLQKILKGKSEE